MIIQDPVTSHGARVGATSGRLQTTAASLGVNAAQTRKGRSWDVSRELTLVNATMTPFLYLKNTNLTEIIFDVLILNAGVSTGGAGRGILRITRNPDELGTIVTDAVAATVQNRNFGSIVAPGANVFQASAAGKTLTGGTTFFDAFFFASSRSAIVLDGGIALPQNTSIGFSVQAPTGNTSMALNLGAVFYNPIEETI